MPEVKVAGDSRDSDYSFSVGFSINEKNVLYIHYFLNNKKFYLYIIFIFFSVKFCFCLPHPRYHLSKVCRESKFPHDGTTATVVAPTNARDGLYTR